MYGIAMAGAKGKSLTLIGNQSTVSGQLGGADGPDRPGTAADEISSRATPSP